MLRRLIVATAALAVASSAFGQAPPTISVEQVPSGNPDLFIIDVSETVGSMDNWSAGGISVRVSDGASLVYALDPNTGDPVLTATDPLGQGREITMVSLPRGQHQNSRFREFGAASIAGAYDPTGPTAISTSTFANIAFFRGHNDSSGYISRVVIDISGTAFSVDALSIVLAEPEPGDSILAGKAATASGAHPNLTEIDFWVSVPEPASLVLLALGGLTVVRRR